MFNFIDCDHDWYRRVAPNGDDYASCNRCGAVEGQPIPFTAEDQRRGADKAWKLNREAYEYAIAQEANTHAMSLHRQDMCHWRDTGKLLNDPNPYYATSRKYWALITLGILPDPS